MRWTRQRQAYGGSQGGLISVSELTARRTTALSRTVKSCGPDAWRLASSLAEARSVQPGWTKPSIREATEAREHHSPRRARYKPLKPLRAGMPGDFRCHRCEYSCAFCYLLRARGCGCIGHPAFPTPSGRKDLASLGRPRVASVQLFVCRIGTASGASTRPGAASGSDAVGVAVTRHAHGDDALCHAGCLKSESIHRALPPAMASSCVRRAATLSPSLRASRSNPSRVARRHGWLRRKGSSP
jgi:hypothetical protein